jgi:hypothetical protein
MRLYCSLSWNNFVVCTLLVISDKRESSTKRDGSAKTPYEAYSMALEIKAVIIRGIDGEIRNCDI